jgi:hypothetical protein
MIFAGKVRGFVVEEGFLAMWAVVMIRTLCFIADLVHVSAYRPIVSMNAVMLIIQKMDCEVRNAAVCKMKGRDAMQETAL